MKMKLNISIGILIFRLSTGTLMLFHGIAKVKTGIDGIIKMLHDAGLPGIFGYGVYLGEVIAPLMIIIGFRTRLAAGVFAVNCIIAMLLAHSEAIFRISKHGGWEVELLGLYLFGGLALIFTGAGNFALSTKNRWD